MKYYIKILENNELVEIAETSFKNIYIESVTYNLILKLVESELPFEILDQKGKKFDINE